MSGPGGAWRVNVPARTGIKRGWLVLRDGEPACPFHPSHARPSRDEARAEAYILRQRNPRSKVRVVPCTLVLGWAP